MSPLRLSLLCAVVLVACLSSVSARRPVDYTGHAVLRVENDRLTPAQAYALKHITQVKKFKVDRWAENDLRVSPEHRAAVEQYLRENALAFKVWIKDLQAEIDREDAHREEHRARCGDNVLEYPNGAEDFFADYHSLSDIATFTTNLAKQYPELVTQTVIGESYGQYPITVFKVTSSVNPHAPNKKPALYFEGGIHAREWIAHATVTYMLNAMVTGYGNDTHITSLLDNFEYHFVPVVNVDGYLYTWTTDRMWRKTTKPNPGSQCIGTDPNRNWDNHWCLPGVGGSTDPCDDSYCGSAPFSEKCVSTVAQYVASQDNIVAAIDFHSYSQLWMTPYGYTSGLPANNAAQTAMSQAAVAALESVYQTQYTEGPIYSTVYPASGSSADWFYDNTTHVQYSFGVELRDTGAAGFLLPPAQIIPSGQETLQAVLAMGDYLLKNPVPSKKHSSAGPQLQFGNMKQVPRRAEVQTKQAEDRKPRRHHSKRK